MNKQIKVFISSPYTLGDKLENVENSLKVADELMDKGITPFAPLLNHYQDLILPRPEKDWMDWDIEWMLTCDAVLRLPGESKGADNEVRIAKAHKIPIFYDIDKLIKYKTHYQFNITQTT